MRITGGNLRGRVIRPPANLPVRPTTDFAKTALFNILNNYFDFPELHVLDLFAGTGAISYEFYSRGTENILAVDGDTRCTAFIKKTSTEFNMKGLRCITADVFKFITNESGKYDIIFADPPFALPETDTLPDLIFEKELLKENGWLIVEHQSKRILNSKIIPFDVRKYSNCSYSMFKNADIKYFQ